MLRRYRVTLGIVVALLVIVLAVVALYRSVLPGLSSARQEAPAVEVAVASWLLRESIPPRDRARVNPLGRDPADIAAGQDLFRQKCEICHGYDGGGKTEIGAGQYPKPPALRSMQVAAHDRRRDFLSYPERNPQHGHAGVVDPRCADLATRRLSAPSASGCAALAGVRRRNEGRRGSPLRRVRRLPVLSYRHL